jgi:hypothetical protein
MCEGGAKIVTVTDRLLVIGQSGLDGPGGLEKASPVHPNWHALYSAEDVSDVRPILDRASVLITGEGRQRFLTEVADIFSRAFALRHQQLIEHRILTPTGFTDLDDFDKRAKDMLPIEEYRYVRQKMRVCKPKCEFLVCGFDPVGMGHIFMQDSTGPWQGYDDPGWWTIGSGAEEAYAALQFQADKLGFGLQSSEGECTYHLLAAKFMAESNRFVGPRTDVMRLAYNKPVRYMDEAHIYKVRLEWEKCGIPRLPRGLIRQIPNMLETVEEHNRKFRAFKEFERRMRSKRPKAKSAKAR